MHSKLVYLACFVLVFSLVGSAAADEFVWDNSGGDSLWVIRRTGISTRSPTPGMQSISIGGAIRPMLSLMLIPTPGLIALP